MFATAFVRFRRWGSVKRAGLLGYFGEQLLRFFYDGFVGDCGSFWLFGDLC
jgi:hypothetical protein